MKTFILTGLLILTHHISSAQNIPTGLNVEMDSKARTVLTSGIPTQEVAAYSINVLNSSEQDGRAKALNAVAMLDKLYPELGGEWVYQAPVFKAICGHWLTRAEATIALNRLKNEFPSAFIFLNTVPLEAVLRERKEALADSVLTKLLQDPKLIEAELQNQQTQSQGTSEQTSSNQDSQEHESQEHESQE